MSATEAWHAEVAIGREIAAEADRIEADRGHVAIGEALMICGVAVRNAQRSTPRECHRDLVVAAAWALVALRAEAREMAAKGGGT